MTQIHLLGRRHLIAGIASLAAVSADTRAEAVAANGPASPPKSTPHKIVYQLNKADDAYQEAIFNSISAMLTKYVDDVAIAVVAWGPGLHLLAKAPKRPVPKLYQQRVRSMAESYGVRFIACGNTMHTIGWTQADMLDFVTVEDVGAAAVMELQEQGYAYLAW
ncbi:MAG: DsrE family protein [Burkholderiales bacterium]|nr:DsrE family protein [Burkholderiales bacterium]